MRIALGAVIAAGHPLEVLDRWSWDQVSLAAEAVTAYHAHLLQTVFGAFTGEGPEKKPGRGRKTGPGSTRIDRTDLDAVKRARDRDAAIMASVMGLGMSLDP